MKVVTAYERKQTKIKVRQWIKTKLIWWIHHSSHFIAVLPDLSEMCIFLLILGFYIPLEWANLIISILSFSWIFQSLSVHERACLIYFCCFSGDSAEFTVSEVSMVLSENQNFFMEFVRSLKRQTKLLIIVLRRQSLVLLIWRRTQITNTKSRIRELKPWFI